MRVRVSLKTLKGGGTEKKGGETKILKWGGGQTGSRGGCLKRGGWIPLMNYYTLSFHTEFQVFKVFKNLLDSYSYIFVTNVNVFTQIPSPTPS